jgi:hypothetical protein
VHFGPVMVKNVIACKRTPTVEPVDNLSNVQTTTVCTCLKAVKYDFIMALLEYDLELLEKGEGVNFLFSDALLRTSMRAPVS